MTLGMRVVEAFARDTAGLPGMQMVVTKGGAQHAACTCGTIVMACCESCEDVVMPSHASAGSFPLPCRLSTLYIDCVNAA